MAITEPGPSAGTAGTGTDSKPVCVHSTPTLQQRQYRQLTYHHLPIIRRCDLQNVCFVLRNKCPLCFNCVFRRRCHEAWVRMCEI